MRSEKEGFAQTGDGDVSARRQSGKFAKGCRCDGSAWPLGIFVNLA